MPTLDWLDRERALKRVDEVPYRLLEAVSGHGDPNTGNLLIQGDNLDALKALLRHGMLEEVARGEVAFADAAA